MIAMIFEYSVHAEHYDTYSRHAQRMRELVTQIPGFVSFERYNSALEDGKILALAFFEDEAAVGLWRNSDEHRRAQEMGRKRYFKEYRLRMAEVVRDYSMDDRDEVPADSLKVHN